MLRAPEPIPYPPPGKVVVALQTSDGKWRVEGIEQGGQQFFRLAHQDNILDGLAIADVERLLAADGVAMDKLIDAPLDTRPSESGAA